MAHPQPGRGGADDPRLPGAQHIRGRGTTAALTYDAAIEYITGLGRFGVKMGLERTRSILQLAGDPQAGLPGVLVAGTNGKGSTAAMVGAILRAAGRRVGTMPSPHLQSYNERIQVDGRPISEEDFAAAVDSLRPRLTALAPELGPPTEFEILTTVALTYLARQCDVLVVEVGMGGRLDATNVLNLDNAIITNVSLDHTQYLGDTLEKIAAEKAGIIKPGNHVLTAAEGSALKVVEAQAAEQDATLWRLGSEIQLRARWRGWEGSEISVDGPGFAFENLLVPLVGEHQAANAALAVAAGHLLGAGPGGISQARWPGRLELVRSSPMVVLDGAHNPAALARLATAIRRLESDRRLVVVFGMMADKDIANCLAELRGLRPAEVVFTSATGSRPARPETLAQEWAAGQVGGPKAEVQSSPVEAAERALRLAGPDGMVLVCGSLYLVGELRDQLAAGPR